MSGAVACMWLASRNLCIPDTFKSLMEKAEACALLVETACGNNADCTWVADFNACQLKAAIDCMMMTDKDICDKDDNDCLFQGNMCTHKAFEEDSTCFPKKTESACNGGPAPPPPPPPNTTAPNTTANCQIWRIGTKGDMLECKATTPIKTYETGKYCVKKTGPSQGCDGNDDKVTGDGKDAKESECEYYGLTTANACCYEDILGKKYYTMCNKDGFGDAEPKDADFTDAKCPNECKKAGPAPTPTPSTTAPATNNVRVVAMSTSMLMGIAIVSGLV